MKYIPLLLILSLYLFTRLFRISEVPVSVYWDEASIGYNAYAVTQDLKDEWGEFLPLHFRAFGEFKLPVYIYSTAVFVKLFGLSIFTVRIASVIYGLIIVLSVFLITIQITRNNTLSSFAAFITAITPWLFIFTRTGYEAVAGLAFFLAGVYFYLVSEKKPKFLLISTLLWIFSIYSYNSFRIIVPVSLGLIILRTISNKRKKAYRFLAVSLVIFIISIIPIYKVTTQDFGGSRFTAIGVEGDSISEKSLNSINNYFSHFSPQFLFVDGDTNPRSQLPGEGQLYLISFPLIILGVYSVLKNKKAEYLLLLVLLAIAPLPAAITREAPHALRSILMAPMFAILAAFGLEYVASNFKSKRIYFVSAVLIIYLLSFESYAVRFFNDYNNLTSEHWQYPYKVVFSENYEGNLYVTDNYAQPYIFALFYNKVEPKHFRSTVEYNTPDKWGFSTVNSFDKYRFGYDEMAGYESVKVLAEKKEDLQEPSVIRFLNDEEALYVYEE